MGESVCSCDKRFSESAGSFCPHCKSRRLFSIEEVLMDEFVCLYCDKKTLTPATKNGKEICPFCRGELAKIS